MSFYLAAHLGVELECLYRTPARLQLSEKPKALTLYRPSPERHSLRPAFPGWRSYLNFSCPRFCIEMPSRSVCLTKVFLSVSFLRNSYLSLFCAFSRNRFRFSYGLFSSPPVTHRKPFPYSAAHHCSTSPAGLIVPTCDCIRPL